MQRFLLILLLIFIPFFLWSQIDVRNTISTLDSLENICIGEERSIVCLEKIDSISNLLRSHFAYVYLRNKLDLANKYNNIDSLKNKATLTFGPVYAYPWITLSRCNKGSYYRNEVRKFCLEAGINYIKGNKDHPEALKHLDVIPSFRSSLYPILKKYIIEGGAEWERGEVPERLIEVRPPLKNIRDGE